MAKVTLTKLKCIRKQDISGQDEPVLFIAGQEVWEGKMGKDEDRPLDESRRFNNSVLVELKERDKKKDKLLKSWTINDTPKTDGKTLTASSSGFHYELSYAVS